MELDPEVNETVSVRVIATEDHAEVCPVFPWGDVPTPIQAITAWHSLSLRSHTRTANSVPYGSPAQGQRYGLTTFPICHTTGLGPAFSPAII